MLTDAQLKRIMPDATDARRRVALPVLNSAASVYEINNERRMAAWLGTIAVESGELRYQEEIASGAAYEGRADLGNTQKGDGRKFKGHGRIQITGRSNTQAYTNFLKRSGHLPLVDFIQEPNRLATEPYATDSAGWFWAIYKKLNPIADRGDFLTTQIRVNGRNKKTGLPNNWAERQHFYALALSTLPQDFSIQDTAAAPSPGNSADKLSTETPIDAAIPPTVAAAPEPIADAPPPVESQSTNILTKADVLGDKVQSISTTAAKYQVPSVPAGLGTRLSVFWKQVIMPAVMAFAGWVSGHWELCLIIAVIIIALGTYEWIENRRRNNPVGAVPDPNAPAPWWSRLVKL